MSPLATVARKSFNGKFTAKIDFPIGHFMLPLLMLTPGGADIESLKSFHTIFDMYLDHILVKFKQNRVVQTKQNLHLLTKKWLTIFEKVLTPVWKTFLLRKQFFDAKILIQ